jgi:hypothetical protein
VNEELEEQKMQEEYILSVAPAMIALMEANIVFAEKYPNSGAYEKLDEIKTQLAEWQGILNGPSEEKE